MISFKEWPMGSNSKFIKYCTLGPGFRLSTYTTPPLKRSEEVENGIKVFMSFFESLF